jgi:hypothetical protein
MKIKLLATLALFLLTLSPAESHSPLPPPPFRLRLSKLILPGKGIYSAQYGLLSGSKRAFLEQARSITTLGINTGYNQTITQGIQGQILSGQLYGTLYEQIAFPGHPFITIGPYILAFGKNPLALNGGVPSGQIAPTSLVNQIVFSGTRSVSEMTSIHVVKSLRPLDPPHLSGAQLAFQNRLNLLTRNSVQEGINRANSVLSSPIIAGQFFGFNYVQFTPGVLTYNRNDSFVYSFGSDPLNILKRSLAYLNTNTLRNYVEFANGQVVTYSSGLIPASLYFPGKPLATSFLFAIGKNPLNYFYDYAGSPLVIKFSQLPTPYLDR